MGIGPKDLRMYPNVQELATILEMVLVDANASTEQVNYALGEWIKGKTFTDVGLFDRPKRYEQGIKKYSEYYTAKHPDGVFPPEFLAVRKDFTDITAPRTITLTMSAVDDVANTVTFAGDYTKYFDEGDTGIAILDGTTYAPKFGGLTVQAGGVTFDGTNTVITFSDFPSAFTAGDITYFQKGLQLKGIYIDIEWYANDGTVLLEKRVTKTMTPPEAALYEYKRRERTVNQMVAESIGKSIEHAVKELFVHYKVQIDKYKTLGDAQGWKDAVDAETDPTINAYLNIVIPVTDLEGNTTLKPLRDHLKDELYMSY